MFDYLSAHADDEVYEYSMVGYLLENMVTEKRLGGPRRLRDRRQRAI